jgi:hypothetical protein
VIFPVIGFFRISENGKTARLGIKNSGNSIVPKEGEKKSALERKCQKSAIFGNLHKIMCKKHPRFSSNLGHILTNT